MRFHVQRAVVAKRRWLHMPVQRWALSGASQAVFANRFVVAIAQRVVKRESQSIALIGSLDTGPRHFFKRTQSSDSWIVNVGIGHSGTGGALPILRLCPFAARRCCEALSCARLHSLH